LKELKNGAKILKDNTTVVDGKEVKNTSNSFTPFIYNVLDKDGNVIDVIQKGKTKVTLYSIEKVL
jgi:hypothetical protein